MATTWDHPFPFIEGINGKLTINKTAAAQLNLIEKEMVIVCIAGSYRTGKSYLMNRLAGKTSGFSLGSTIESHTKGIWVWNVDHPLDPNKSLLLMDTEGLGDPFKGDNNHDAWISCLAVLLSSVFVYNIMGRIEKQVIDELTFVSEMSQYIQGNTNSTCDMQFDEFFPNFILAIRDFLLIPKLNGSEVTADEYMEQMMLTMQPSTKETDIKHNEIKMKIRSYFKNRKCFFFPRPTLKNVDLRRIDSIPDDKLQNAFVDCSKQFCDHIYTTAPVKKIDLRQGIIGRVFTHLAKLYVDAINGGVIPCVETAVTQIAHKENNQALQESHSFYVKMMEELLSLPVTNEQLMLIHENCYKQAVDLFLKKVFFDESKEYHAQLQESLNNEYVKYQANNRKTSAERCNQILRKLLLPVDEKIRSGKYITGGGYKQYEEDIAKIKIQYKSIPEKGIMDGAVLFEILTQRETEREFILQSDKKLSDGEKLIEIERNKKNEHENKIELLKQDSESIRKQEESLIKTHEEHLNALKDTYEKKMKLQEENGKKLQKKREKELERLLNEKFENEKDRLKAQIEAAKEQQPSFGECALKVVKSATNCSGAVLTWIPIPKLELIGLGLRLFSNSL